MSVIAVCFLALIVPASSITAKDRHRWEDMHVKVGDIKIHYLEAGAGNRALVLIPGWTMPAEVWKEQIPYFAYRGFRVIAFDPRSQGETTKTEGGNTYRQQAADLHAFLKALQIERPCLVGWSSGVTVLLEYVSSPESLQPERLVFVDGAPAGSKIAEYPGSMTTQQARRLVSSLQADRPKAVEQFVRSMFKERQPESLYRELTDHSLKTPIGAAVSLLFDLFTGDRRAALAHVPVPTLILTTVENSQIGEYMKSNITQSRLHVIEGAGHAMFLDRPQAFNQALESFLGER